MMRVCVIGAGAIGGVIAAWLARAGHQVTVVARADHLAALQTGGLRLEDRIAGSGFTVPVDARPSAAGLGHQDLVVLGVKGPAMAEVLPQVGPLLGKDTIVLPAINGVPWWYFLQEGGPFDGRPINALDPDGHLLTLIPAQHLVGCVVHVAGEMMAPGVIAQTAHRKLIIGDVQRGTSKRLQALGEVLGQAGFEAVVSSDIRRDLWVKLIGNLAFNPLAALTGMRMDEMLAQTGLVALARQLIEESNQVARALGVETGIDTETRITMARTIGRARLSTLQDFDRGRRPELEGLLGSVIELAAWVHQPVPTIEHVAALTYARARALGLIT
jgi:2-dehydropantoate 2-reductase